MQDTVEKFGPLAGRILIALIFLLSGFGKITGFAGTAGYMASKGLPMVDLLLVITILIEFGGALLLIAGFKARLAALALFLWMIPVTLVFHNFWALPADQQMIQQIMFMKNLSIMGAMLYIMAFGSGPLSVDKK
jgi:putative oxidoreductase